MFLDEIGHMPLSFQQKICASWSMERTRRGRRARAGIRARLVAATNMDLEPAMREGRFLRDLHDRLAFEVVRVPPLRERTGDVDLLSEHFLAGSCARCRARPEADQRRQLRAAPPLRVPGNVRELKHIIERAAYRDTTNEINPDDIGPLDTGRRLRRTRRLRGARRGFQTADRRGRAEPLGREPGRGGASPWPHYDQIRYYCQTYDLGRRRRDSP